MSKPLLEQLIFARDELVRLNDKVYDLMTQCNPHTADQIEETIDTVSIIMEEVIEQKIKSN